MTRQSVVTSGSEPGSPDYRAVEFSTDDRSEWSYVERRAELLQLLEERATPAH